ncbi:zinc finger protein 777-like isoform X3 [Ambystoma mexicanum]|uniref:zinc finger protein 777-like isoform X3 n=1 Tax=Ambystoma mexicanum TaxID=8296 RepID=UPI0037E7084A
MRGMPQKESVEVPVSSYDCSACFSKEEWALLHEWQKELYKNVMNEIHSALISLGYTIHGTLLRMNGGEAVHIRDPEHSESRADTNDSTYHSTSCGFEDLPSCSYISGSLPSCTYPTPKPLDNLLNEDLQEPGETGEPVLSVVIRADENTCLADPVETDRRAQNNYLSAELLIAPVKIKEEKVFFAVDHENFKFRKNDHPRCASDRPEGSDYFSTEFCLEKGRRRLKHVSANHSGQ